MAQMQREAQWTDRTGQARAELQTAVEWNGATVTLYLISGAPHGQYLELRWGGRYGIVCRRPCPARPSESATN